jgi:hypothetical protein
MEEHYSYPSIKMSDHCALIGERMMLGGPPKATGVHIEGKGVCVEENLLCNVDQERNIEAY